MNFYLYRDLLSGAWHMEASTFAYYYPMAVNAIKGITQFDEGEEEAVNKPFHFAVQSQTTTTASGGSYVKVIPVRGVMLRDDAACGPVGTRTIAARLLEADKESGCLGCILLFDSGGGQSSAVPELAKAITASQKPVVAYVDGMACSAAMYAAAYCAEIIAHSEADYVGCIGTMISFAAPQNGAQDSNGNTYLRIYADGSEEKNEEYEKALTGDFKLIKERVLNPHNEQFKADIRRLRPAVTEAHLKGRTYEAKDVIGILVDSIGDLEYAASRVADRSTAAQQPANQSNLNMNNYPHLLAVLGVATLATQDGHASFNEEQLAALEAALAKPAADATALAAANATIAQRDETISLLNAKIEALGKKPGADPAAVVKDTDADEGSHPDNETFYARFNRLREETQSQY